MYVDEVPSRGYTLVKTQLVVGKKKDTIVWRVHPRNGEMMVSDLYVGNKDLLGRLSERFHKQIQRHGINGLIAWMHQAADVDEDHDLQTGSTPTGQAG